MNADCGGGQQCTCLGTTPLTLTDTAGNTYFHVTGHAASRKNGIYFPSAGEYVAVHVSPVTTSDTISIGNQISDGNVLTSAWDLTGVAETTQDFPGCSPVTDGLQCNDVLIPTTTVTATLNSDLVGFWWLTVNAQPPSTVTFHDGFTQQDSFSDGSVRSQANADATLATGTTTITFDLNAANAVHYSAVGFVAGCPLQTCGPTATPTPASGCCNCPDVHICGAPIPENQCVSPCEYGGAGTVCIEVP